MEKNDCKKKKNLGTMINLNREMQQLQLQREDVKDLNIDEKIENEKEYIKEGIEVVKNSCRKEFERLKIRLENNNNINNEYNAKLDELREKWIKTNDKLVETIDKQDNLEIIEKAANHMCEIISSIDNKDFRTYNILPIWNVDNQPTSLEQAMQNYELIIDDYLNTLGSKGLEKFDKSENGYEYRQKIDKDFENAVISLDINKAKECLDRGAYVDLQLEGNINLTALNYILMDNSEENTLTIEEKIEFAKLLLEYGANSDIKYYLGNSIDREMRIRKEISPILKAVEMGNYELVSQILRNNNEIDLQTLEKILDNNDTLFVKRVLNEISLKRTRRRARMTKKIKIYLEKEAEEDVIINMYNNKLVNADEIISAYTERGNIELLKALDKLGYEFDFSNKTTRLLFRTMIERRYKDGINFVLDKFKNFELQKYMKKDGNVQQIKNKIEIFADLELLDKIHKKDKTLDLSDFKIVIPNTKYMEFTEKYLNLVNKLRDENVDISLEPLGVSNEFDNLVAKMIRRDMTYREDNISLDTLIKKDEKGNSIFNYIAAFGDVDDLNEVEEEVNFNINAQNLKGETPLSCAIKAGNIEMCEELLSRSDLNPNIDLGLNINPNFHYRETYLTQAITSNEFEVARRIINYLKEEKIQIREIELKLSISSGAHDIARNLISLCDNKDMFGENIIQLAASCGDKEIVKELLNKELYKEKEVTVKRLDIHGRKIKEIEKEKEVIKLDINEQDEMGNTALFEAVKNQDIEMINLLVKNKANINIKNKCFETPILYAVKNNLKDSSRALIELGANLSIQECSDDKKYGTKRSVLHYAQDKEMLQELITNGASPYKKDAKGRYAFDVDRLSNLYMKLDEEINKKDFDEEKVDRIIKNMGEDINTPTPYRTNFTAVQYAAYRGNLKILQKLIENGGNVNVRDNGHTDALMSAIMAKKEDCALYLIDKGIDLEHTDRIGNNALMMSIYNGLDNVAKKIINKGVNLEKKMRFGSPLIIAIECKRVDIIKELVDNNVNLEVKNMYGIPAIRLIEDLKKEYKKEDREYKILDDVLKDKTLEKTKGLDINI